MLGEGALDELDVAALRVIEPLGAAEAAGRREPLAQAVLDVRLDLGLDRVGQLVAVAGEQLDSVVGEGVVRGRDHDPEIGAQAAGEDRDRRRWHRTGENHVHAHRDEAGGQRRLDEVAREPRVLADDDAMAVLATDEVVSRRHADPKRGLGGHRFGVRGAANAVGTKILACHVPSRRCGWISERSI